MDYNKLLNILGFKPEDGKEGVFFKAFSQVDNYRLKINTIDKSIDYGPDITIGMSSTLNFSQAENWVVLECVDRLLTKGYRPSSLTLEKTFPSGHGTSGRLDILVNREDGTAFLMIECKTFGKEYTKELNKIYKNGGQLFTYFQQDKNADILMLYASTISGNKIEYVNEIINIEDDYRQTANVSDFFDRWNKLAKQNGIFETWVTTYDFQSKALTPPDLKEIEAEDSSFIFNQFLEILRHNVVSDKPNAFNKIFTLFLCKIFDEKNTRDTEELAFQWFYGPFTYDGIHYDKDDHISFQKRLTDLYKKGMYAFLDKEVTDISDAEFDRQYSNLEASVRDAIKHTFTEIRLKKNNEFAIKEVFNDDSFLENAKVVKEVVELLQNFKIRYTKKQQYLSDFFELLLTTGLKQESGQFFTPVPIAQYVIKSLPLDVVVKEKLANGTKGDESLLPYIIDYAAGSGHFITESMHEIQSIIDKEDPADYHGDTAKRIKHWKDDHFDWAYTYIYGIEKDYRLVKVGKVGCYLHGDGLANIVHSDGLGRFTRTKEYAGKLKKSTKDFPQDNNQFDIVVSNPPYSVSSFRNNASKYYNAQDFNLYNRLTDNSSEIECLFIERTKQLLSEGGLAGVILPSSILSNTGICTKTREIIFDYFEIVAITELGGNTFMATNTNTVVLFLRKRDNYFAVNLKAKVKKLWKDGSNVTINGVENALQKYIEYVWEGLSIEDYKSLIATYPNEAVKQHELYQDYHSKIKGKAEPEKWKKIHDLEKDKFYYFVLSYTQNVVITRTGEKKAEKVFLGYEFSNRRGNEGIHPIQKGRSIDECTSLFDPVSFTNPEKASSYVYRAFIGDFDESISTKLQGNIKYGTLLDMLTFDRPDFEKTVSLVVKKKFRIESIYSSSRLGYLTTMIKRGKSAKYGQSETQIIKSGQARGGLSFDFSVKHFVAKDFKLDERQLLKGDLLFNSTGVGTAGRVTLFNLEGSFVADSHISIIRLDHEKVIPRYLLSIFERIGFRNLQDLALGQSGQIEISYDTLYNFKVPIPPKEIQVEIVSSLAVYDEQEQDIKAKIIQMELSKFGLLRTSKTTELKNYLSGLNPNKSNIIKDLPDDAEVSFLSMEDVSNDGIIKQLQLRPLSAVKTGYTFFQEEDILFAKITPCMENGKGCYVNSVLSNNVGFGSTEFFVLRPDTTKIFPAILHLMTQSKEFRLEAEKNMTGTSGHRRVPKEFLENYLVPLLTLKEQKPIFKKLIKLDEKISKLKNDLLAIPEKKTQIMDKFLK